MAESLPGTMSIFGDALATLTGSGLTGQAAIQELYRAVESGEVMSADILPLVAEEMSRRAQPKLGIMKRSSIAESARVVNEWNELLERFSKAGGEEGFAKFFRSIAEQLPRLTPLIEAFGAGFIKLANAIEPTVRMFANYTQVISELKQQMDAINPSIAVFVAGFAALATKIGRLMIPLTLFYLILEDIAIGMMGGNAYSTHLFDFLDKLGEYDRKIVGVAMAVLTLVAAFKMLKWIRTGGVLPGGRGRRSPTTGNRGNPAGEGRGSPSLKDRAVSGFRENPLLWMFGGHLLARAVMNPFGAILAGGYLGFQTHYMKDHMSFNDNWLRNMAGKRGVIGYRDQNEYIQNLFSSSEKGFLTPQDIEEHFSGTKRSRNWLSDYLERSPKSRAETLEDLAAEFNEKYSTSRMIRQGDYFGPLLGGVGDQMPQDYMGNTAEYLNQLNRNNPINPTINNEINLNADGVLDPEGVRGVMQDLMPELEETLNRSLQDLFSTTQDAYGG